MNMQIMLIITLSCVFLSGILIEESLASELEYVTCGSVVKLVNTRSDVRLHSHDVKYGSGSGQQSVTGVQSTDDNNSYWQIKGKQGVDCMRGKPIKCGQTIRMLHLNTRKNLHSHHFQSPLSNNFEVSAFGEDGEGDEGDNWSVQCNEEFWEREDRVRFKHGATGSYLHISGDTFGRPIHGQKEVSAYQSPNDMNYWKVAEGVYVKPADMQSGDRSNDHDEL